jgi:hypothetical protein
LISPNLLPTTLTGDYSGGGVKVKMTFEREISNRFYRRHNPVCDHPLALFRNAAGFQDPNLLRVYPENPAQPSAKKSAEINAAHWPILPSRNHLIFGWHATYILRSGNGGHHVETGSDLRSRQH